MDKKWRKSIFQLLLPNGRYFLTVALKYFFKLGIPIDRVPTSKKMRILHLKVSQVPSQCKDHLVEKVSWMYKGWREDVVLIFLLLYKALYKSLKCDEVSFWNNKIRFAEGGISKKHLFFWKSEPFIEKCWIHLNVNLQVLHNVF